MTAVINYTTLTCTHINIPGYYLNKHTYRLWTCFVINVRRQQREQAVPCKESAEKKQRHQPGWIFSCMPPVASQSSTALCVKKTPRQEKRHTSLSMHSSPQSQTQTSTIRCLTTTSHRRSSLKTSFADKRKRRKSRSPVSRKSSFRPRPTNMKRLKRSQVFSPKKTPTSAPSNSSLSTAAKAWQPTPVMPRTLAMRTKMSIR